MKVNRFFLDEVWLTEAVLIEIANALASSNRSAAVAFIKSCYITPNVRAVSVDSKLLKRAMDFYKNRGIYSRRPLSAGRLPGTVT